MRLLRATQERAKSFSLLRRIYRAKVTTLASARVAMLWSEEGEAITRTVVYTTVIRGKTIPQSLATPQLGLRLTSKLMYQLSTEPGRF